LAKKQRHEEHEEHVDESWLIPYADLLTLLLALFIVLFASSQVDSKKLQKMAESMNDAFDGGRGFLEFFGVTEPMRDPDPDSKNRTTEESAGSDNVSIQGESEEQFMTPEEMAKQAEAEAQEQQDLNNLKKELDTYINENGLTTQLETTQADHYVMITIRDQALFASGSALIKPEAQVLAGAISNILTAYPDYQVTVTGHTDNIPITSKTYDSNWDLSTARSLNFMKELFKNPNVGQARFSSTGFGEFRPIASNDTNEGRAKNRRVEVSIISPSLVSAKQLPVQ
jgi:chemotaxis protein MotB